MKSALPDGATVAARPAALAFVPRKLDPEDIATLMSRGERLFASGDIASARLLFQRAAEANNPGAALALATTFDPAFLSGIGISNATADLALARAWYEKAKMLGSLEASQRLDVLASHP
jgi:TPR repeat protein